MGAHIHTPAQAEINTRFYPQTQQHDWDLTTNAPPERSELTAQNHRAH